MRHAKPGNAEDKSHEHSLLRCEELAHHAIDRLGMGRACRLSPRDRLASVAAVLKEIREGLERRSARKGTPGPNTEPGFQDHSQDRARLPG